MSSLLILQRDPSPKAMGPENSREALSERAGVLMEPAVCIWSLQRRNCLPLSSLSPGLPGAFHGSSQVLATRCFSSEPTKGLPT